MLHLVVLLVALAMMLTGIVMWFLAFRLRTELCPTNPFNPRNWIPVWRMKPWFTPRGYRLNVTGAFMISGGALLYILHHWLK